MATDERFVFLDTQLAGAPHHMTELEALALPEGTALVLVPEPQNAYDSNAIRLDRAGGKKAGYISRTLAPMVGALLRNGYDVQAHVAYVGAGMNRQSFTVAIALTLPVRA